MDTFSVARLRVTGWVATVLASGLPILIAGYGNGIAFDAGRLVGNIAMLSLPVAVVTGLVLRERSVGARASVHLATGLMHPGWSAISPVFDATTRTGDQIRPGGDWFATSRPGIPKSNG